MWYAYLAVAVGAVLATFMFIPYSVAVRLLFEAQPLSLNVNIQSKLSKFNWNHHLGAGEFKQVPLQKGGLSSRQRFFLHLLLKRLVVQKMVWKTWLGVDDAMLTAVGTGLVWAVKGSLVSYLTRICSVRAIKIEVNPDFYTARCSTQLDCIFKIRLVHYIYILIWMRLKRREHDHGRKTAKGK
ncbi:MAG: DUF2953 domain-containing protein [Syntrophomonadaceae bacterium]|jgi:hypothetical protein